MGRWMLAAALFAVFSIAAAADASYVRTASFSVSHANHVTEPAMLFLVGTSAIALARRLRRPRALKQPV